LLPFCAVFVPGKKHSHRFPGVGPEHVPRHGVNDAPKERRLTLCEHALVVLALRQQNGVLGAKNPSTSSPKNPKTHLVSTASKSLQILFAAAVDIFLKARSNNKL
jgi:hypothetical protein